MAESPQIPSMPQPIAANSKPEEVPVEAERKIPALVNGRFEMKEKLGSGSYSDVFLAVDNVSGEKVAVKIEWTKAERGQRLLQEARLYESLAGTQDAPRVHWWGTEAEHHIMVMDLLGPSLEDLFCACGRRFSLKTVLLLAEQMIDRLQYVHSKGIIHRDIKPNNFLMGLGEHSSRVYIMDFGLAKRYLDADGQHIPCNRKRGLTGTVRYTSLNVHRGLEPSRRDDLGAIGYVLMYFNRGRLPWQGVNAKSKRTKHRKIGTKKEQVSHNSLCQGYPPEFVKYLEHCDSLPYPDAPDYDYLRGLLRAVLARERLECDWVYDWMLPPRQAPGPAPPCGGAPKSLEAGVGAQGEAGASGSRKRRRCEQAECGEAALEPADEYGYSEYDESEEEEEESEEEYDYDDEGGEEEWGRVAQVKKQEAKDGGEEEPGKAAVPVQEDARDGEGELNQGATRATEEAGGNGAELTSTEAGGRDAGGEPRRP